MDTALAARWIKAYDKVETRCLGIHKTAQGYEVKSDSGATYLVTGRGNVATDCTCPAGRHGDDVCWHRAAVYALIGAFDHLRPQPDPIDGMGVAPVDWVLLPYWSATYDEAVAQFAGDARAEWAAKPRVAETRARACRFIACAIDRETAAARLTETYKAARRAARANVAVN